MNKFFKRILYFSLCVVLCLCLSSCEKNDYYDGFNDGYDGGYYDGYADGLDDGVVEGQRELGGYADSMFDDVCSEYDIEDALAILILYADGESFSEEEIFSAIQTVSSFYDDVCGIIHNVEYYYD